MTKKSTIRRRKQKTARELEEFNIDESARQRDTTQPDRALFFVDRRGPTAVKSPARIKKAWQRRELHRDRSFATVDEAPKPKRVVEPAVKRLAGKKSLAQHRENATRERKINAAKHGAPKTALYDLWAAPAAGNDWVTKQEKPMKHPSSKYMPSALPAVEPPAPGESYRPRPEDYADEVAVAKIQAAARQRAADHIERQRHRAKKVSGQLLSGRAQASADKDHVLSIMQYENQAAKSAAHREKLDAAFQKREAKRKLKAATATKEGDTEDEADESEDVVEEAATEEQAGAEKTGDSQEVAAEPSKKKKRVRNPMFEDFQGKPGEIKTRIQRKREEREKKLAALRRKSVVRSRRAGDWSQIGRVARRIELDAKRKQMAKAAARLNEIDRETAPKHIGPHPMISAPKVVLPEDELPTNLRKLPMTAQKGLAREMFRRLQRRNVIERSASNSARSEERRKLLERRTYERENKYEMKGRKYKFIERRSAKLPLSDPLSAFLPQQ